MSGATGTNGWSVSSWGWLTRDGDPADADDAAYRLWSVTGPSGCRRGFLALPCDEGATDVLVAAWRAWGDDDDE